MASCAIKRRQAWTAARPEVPGATRGGAACGRVLYWLAIGIFGAIVPAAADTLRLSDCSRQGPTIITYNEGDGVCWIPRNATALPSCGTVTFTCDGKCKVRVDGEP